MIATLEKLTDQLRSYCEEQSLPHYSACELIHEDLTPAQRTWVSDFMERWDEAERLAPPRRIGGFKEDHGDDGYGGSFTSYHVCEVPADWTDEQIRQWVQSNFYSYRCEHEYDCCGNYYPGSAEWARADVDAWRRPYVRSGEGEEQPPLKILVEQGWSQNV